MRLEAIEIEDVPPIKRFQVAGLADAVVLAGRNGIGKTRLVAAIIQCLRSPSSPRPVTLTIGATSSTERADWGKDCLVTGPGEDAQKLTATLQAANRRRVNWKSSIVQFESDRSIQRIKPFAFSWDVGDPWEENVDWDQTFGFLRDRFQDTIHSMFRKVQARRNKIARTADALIKKGKRTMELDFDDPLQPFKEAFHQLLGPKRLVNPDPQTQDLQYEYEGTTHSITTLSSGEREVLNVVFDFLLRQPSDCIVFFDEPELHLHPELSYKLLQTLQHVGARNQFVFCTHSPDIITASLDQSVVFIGPPHDNLTNQAFVVKDDDETNEALRLLGQSVGIIALGRKLVLIEGQQASLDKQLYGSILGEQFPELVLVPSEGRDIISSFASVNEKVLSRTIWGVDFFMVCDRDAVPPDADVASLEISANGRLRVLPRYHVENYLLNAGVIAEVFADLEPAESSLRSEEKVQATLLGIARSRLSHTVALYVSSLLRQSVGNVDLMPADCHNKTLEDVKELIVQRGREESVRVAGRLSLPKIEAAVDETWAKLEGSLTDGSWMSLFPGRPIFNIFAAETKLGSGRLKRAYLRTALATNPGVFDELVQVFSSFT